MGVAYNSRIVTDGLVLCLDAANPKSYPGSGTTWTDLTPNKFSPTLINGVAYSSDNKGFLTFDGSNDYCSTTTLNYDDSGGSFTLCAWIKPTSFNSSSTYLAILNRTDGNHVFSTFLSSNLYTDIPGVETGAMSSWIFNTSNALNQSTSYDLVPNLNQWNFCVWHWQDTVGYTYHLFNQNSYQKYTYSMNLVSKKDSTSSHTIGRWYGSNFHYAGSMSSINFYGRGLTDSEIQQNFNALRGRYGI